MNRVAIFASGSGSNAENIIHYFSDKKYVVFPLVISNKSEAFVHERAKRLGISSFSFTKDQFMRGDVLSLLQKENINFIVLAGFLLKVPENILKAFPNKIVNIHPALLPKFGGKGMYGDFVHKAVVEAGEKESGITIHYVNENYDEGQIIFQAKCPVLAQKVHALEYEFFPKILEKLWIH